MSTTECAAAAERESTPELFPFLDLKAQFAAIRSEVLQAAQRVLESQQLILGPEVAEFEKQMAQAIGVKFAIGCASGSDALVLALQALGIHSGDEVITTPFTFVATAGSIARLNAKPVFVDVDPLTYNLDPEQLAAAITDRTRAILPVHMFGLAADTETIMRLAGSTIPVIEDAAQAIGARSGRRQVGSIGLLGCFSFFPSKNLGGAGDGGLVTTNDPQLADRVRLMRVHGCRRKHESEVLGFNSRLDTLQAAILSVKLQYLDSWTAARRRNAARYRALFVEFGLQDHAQMPVEDSGHVYNQFVIRVEQRDALRVHLRQHGIPTEIYYPSPLHLQPAFAKLGYRPGDFPQSESASRQVLALPIFPELREDQQRAVVKATADFFY
jgi:dTDP-4-amino-4,6-dideoxygalactose transaminase